MVKDGLLLQVHTSSDAQEDNPGIEEDDPVEHAGH